MSATLIKIHPDNPAQKRVLEVVDCLRNGGVVIYPTDTVYGMGCDITNARAIDRVARIKGLQADKANFAFICYDLSHISEFAKVDNATFKVMKKALPGPFTFILNASSNVPKLLNTRKKTVGIRVPNHNIPRQIVKELGNPIVTTSIRDDDEVVEYSTDPELIFEKYRDLVDIVIDGGYGNNVASTVVNFSNGQFEVEREGLGDITQFV
ncbi:tRNA threonylcarbamoyl adenosine modification protein, Sua5/YciO/YrdC/YwlC family [Catalinimonas alkaloidigena]|uniref:tRNA threonylcarbamoyl adenosine modification protein, Sua5/YciO/YrdC/YwlC family n=1 Tax=Catalinimonas alkaloidigena TaxID=1075417 RepID=A0A1G9AKD4_9BACT|nr:L-threonylcarbamoyladenylate synthase [Catalinimonas alkaloidigena]SDK27819.1 tRNA threonylcarbamoyl adenosine modification protein, Sua5/YciO/YrdC/YwlC family [Catalinimonas alkaloidigena]